MMTPTLINITSITELERIIGCAEAEHWSRLTILGPDAPRDISESNDTVYQLTVAIEEIPARLQHLTDLTWGEGGMTRL